MESNSGNELVLELATDSVPELKLPGNELEDLAKSEEIIAQTRKREAIEESIVKKLSPEELEAIENLSKQIDISNSSHILQYGVAAQEKISNFSGTALNSIRGKDLGESGKMITSLVTEIKEFGQDADEKKGFMTIFKKPAKKIDELQASYNSVEKNIDTIVRQLEDHKRVLLTDITMLDKMYQLNLDYFKELAMYLVAGRKKIEEVENGQLKELRAKAAETGTPEDAQAANDLANQINRFDKKLHDLDLTRNISIQMGPQIRLVQGNNAMMVEKIQSSIVNTIPLWKNQMVLTLGLQHSKQAIAAQREVTDVTNKLLRENADVLKTSTIEAARESERGIVDIETLTHTNQSLIETLDEVLKIQQDGYQKRREAELELRRIEEEMKTKLLETRDPRQTPEQK